MLRRAFNSLLETTLQAPAEAATYPNPFTKPETVNFGWLSALSPCFPLNSKNIKILTEPPEFYAALKHGCSVATKRIYLASLYLGTGKLERNLVATLKENEEFKNGNLRVDIVLDYMRGSRSENNSRRMLLPLLQNEARNCAISLYHTPFFRGYLKKILPQRWNELIGLQHMKLYIFDNTLIISGANLSNDYFTNRQDRYFVIQDKRLCDFYCGLIKRVQKFSLKLDKHDQVELAEEWDQLPYEGDKSEFVRKAGDLIEKYLLESRDERNIHKEDGYDTWIFPLVQMGQLGIFQDAQITQRIISSAPPGAHLNIATGYFNLTNQYMSTIINQSQASCDILMAHPRANGFLGAKGPAGGIPYAYSLIAHQFKKQYEESRQGFRIALKEYLRDNWTYHGKGLWYYAPNQNLPCLTLIGSPNFGERSVKRDLETQLAIVTESDELKKRLDEECCNLYKYGLKAEVERDVATWVHGRLALLHLGRRANLTDEICIC